MAPKKKDSNPDKAFNIGDIVLVKVKGYPAWPGHIVPNESANPVVRKDKPVNSKNIFLVEFFPTGDFSWSAPRDLIPLSPKEIDAYLSDHNRSKGKKGLYEGYETAKDPTDWIEGRAREKREWEEEQAALMANEDELASDEETSKAAGKKRKRQEEKGKKEGPDDKKSKKEKKEKLQGLAAKRTGGSKAAGPNTGAYSEDEASAPPPPKKAAKPDQDEEPGMKQVREWRHKLQKVFLGKTGVVADDVAKCKDYFDSMEKFEMKKEWLAESKLGKVLKRIAILTDKELPQDTPEFNFRTRASNLAQTWQKQLAGAGTPPVGTPTPAPAANGEKENGKGEDVEMAPPAPAPVGEEKKKEEQVEKPVEPAPVPAPAPAPVEEKKAEEPKVVEQEAPKEEAKPMEVDAPAPQTNGTAQAEAATAPAPSA